MHIRRPGVRAARVEESEAGRDDSVGVSPETESAVSGPQGRLILEKRPPKPAEHSWPAAIDDIHRSVAGLELAGSFLEESEKRYHAFFEGATVGMFQMSPIGRLLNINAAMARILGYESSEQVLEDSARGESPRFFGHSRRDDQKWWGEERSPQSGVDVQIVCRKGEKKWVRLNVREIWTDGRLVRLEGTAEDVTKRKLAELRTELLAYHDILTGLPNRTLFYERLEETLAGAREMNRRVALMLVELEEFKVINDSKARGKIVLWRASAALSLQLPAWMGIPSFGRPRLRTWRKA
jgi:PAS domain S-box-containing protein